MTQTKKEEVATADLLDSHPSKGRVVSPGLIHFGAKEQFYGRIQTVRCFEDNTFVRTMLEQDGNGKILVIDGGGSLRCALLGDNLAALAKHNKWEGILVNGCIRDAHFIRSISLGVLGIATHPRKSRKCSTGLINTPVHFSEVHFIPDEWIYVDADGIVVSTEPIHATKQQTPGTM